MGNNELTDIKYWVDYWKDFAPFKVDHVLFEEYFEHYPEGELSFLEIGGFPGVYSVYFKKTKNYDVTLLDYYIDSGFIQRMEEINGLPHGSISLIEEDIFKFDPSGKRYDIVLSSGFIEHFKDTDAIIGKHVELLGENGKLFLGIPNFLGLNGFIQKCFDMKSYNAHNLKIMDFEVLADTFAKYPLKNVIIEYSSTPGVWIEKNSRANILVKLAVRVISRIISYLRVKNKLLSPYIIITAEKR